MTATAHRDTVRSPVMRTTPDLYDDVAPYYRAYRRWWLAIAGDGAERRLRRALRRALRPGIRVLDAGAGTGALSQTVRDEEPTARVTLLDRSAGMLAEARGVGRGRVRGDVEALPFPSRTFDLVTAAWVLETLPDPAAATREMLRVLGPDGRLLTVFSARPRRRLTARLWQPLERVIAAGFAGRFVRTAEIPFHECGASERRLARFAPTGTVFLGRCCLERLTVEPASVAARTLVPYLRRMPAEPCRTDAATADR